MQTKQTIEQIKKILGEDYFVQTVPLYTLINELTRLVQVAVMELGDQNPTEFIDDINCECRWRSMY